MKKFVAIIFAAMMVLTVSGCGIVDSIASIPDKVLGKEEKEVKEFDTYNGLYHVEVEEIEDGQYRYSVTMTEKGLKEMNSPLDDEYEIDFESVTMVFTANDCNELIKELDHNL